MPDIREERRQYFSRQLKRFLDDKDAKSFLRDYQLTTLQKTLAHTDSGQTSGSIEAPAGSGKTELIFAALDAMCHRCEEGGPMPHILVVEPTRRLIKQTRDRLTKKFPDLAAGVYYSEKKDLDQPITFITQDSFYTLAQQGVITPENTDMLLIDEAHRVLSDRRRKVIEKFKPSSLIIGYTASSEFDEMKGVYRILGEQIHKITDKELVDAGWLAPRANIIAEVKVPANGNGGNGDGKAAKEAYTNAVLGIYKSYRDDKKMDHEPILGQKGLIYAFDVDHAEKIVTAFNTDPHVVSALQKITGNPDIVPATLVKGEMSEKQLNDRFDALKDGKTQILVGDKLFVEGIDIPDAAWRMRRAGESQVEAIQTGGRVSRLDENNPAKTGRVFDIYMPSSHIKKPVFYKDVLGTSRLGRVNADASTSRYFLPEGVETAAPPANVKLYNTEQEVNGFLQRLRPEKKRGTAVTFVPASTMAEEMGAWPQEMERIFEVLQANYYKTPPETHIAVGSVRVPRSMIHDVQLNGVPAKTFMLRDDAKSILADTVTPLTAEGGAFLTEHDVLERLQGLRGGEEDIKNLFKDLSARYPREYLRSQFPLPGETEPPTTEIVSQGVSVPLNSLARVQTESGVQLGIHEDTISKLWHKQVGPKTAADVPQYEYGMLIGAAGGKNLRFRALWEDILHRYDNHPFRTVNIDGETIECGYKRGPSGNVDFCIDRKHKDWVKAQLGKDLGSHTDEWLSYDQFLRAMGPEYYTNTTVQGVWRNARSAFDKAPAEPVVINGHTVRCGFAQGADSSDVFCLHRDEAVWAKSLAKKMQEQYVQKKKDGYLTIQEAADALVVGYDFVRLRAGKFIPDADYAPDGGKPTKDGPTVKGSDLVWRNPHAGPGDKRSVLISTALVETWRKGKNEAMELQSEGYLSCAATSRIDGMNLSSSVVKWRAKHIKPDGVYNQAGLPPGEGEPVFKGSILVSRNPYAPKPDARVLIHPKLAAAWKATEQFQKQLEDKPPEGMGYICQSEIARITGLNEGTVNSRLVHIKPEENYTLAGLQPAEGQEGIKGKDIYWANPYSGVRFVRPELVEAWRQDVEHEKFLIGRKFRRLNDVVSDDLSHETLMHRLNAIDPDKKYTLRGTTPAKGDAVVKGNELFWKSAYSGKGILVSDKLCAGWEEAVRKGKELVAEGYLTPAATIAAAKISATTLRNRLPALEARANAGEEGLLWRDPYSKDVLYDPAVIKELQQQLPVRPRSIKPTSPDLGREDRSPDGV